MNSLSQLSIHSWNVRGIEEPRKYVLVKDTIRNANANFIFLQETK
jgi:exonuclease III